MHRTEVTQFKYEKKRKVKETSRVSHKSATRVHPPLKLKTTSEPTTELQLSVLQHPQLHNLTETSRAPEQENLGMTLQCEDCNTPETDITELTA